MSKNDEKKEKISKVFICLASVGPFQIYCSFIVGKGGHTPFSRSTPPFSKIPTFLEIQDVPTFHRPIRKKKAPNNSRNQFLYHFYPQGILISEGCLQKR